MFISRQKRCQDLVRKAIDELGYRMTHAARMLRTQRSNTIAIFIPHVRQEMPTNIFFMDVLSARQGFYAIGRIA